MTNPEPKPATYVIRRVVDNPQGGTSVLYWLHNANPCFPGRWVPQSRRATQYQSDRDLNAALSEIPRDEATGARVVRLKPKAKPQPATPEKRDWIGSHLAVYPDAVGGGEIDLRIGGVQYQCRFPGEADARRAADMLREDINAAVDRHNTRHWYRRLP